MSDSKMTFEQEIERLKSMRSKDQNAIEAKDHEIVMLKSECQKLTEQLSDFKKCVEFYADLKHWKTITVENENQRFCIMQGSDLEYFQEPNRDSYGGKLARAMQSKWGSRG